MKPVTTFLVRPTLPAALAPLRELAYNYWWCWDAGARDLFAGIAPKVWEDVHHNPVALLHTLHISELETLAASASFQTELHRVYERFRAYMQAQPEHDLPTNATIAYFCAEFGIHESFMNYSGGLGVLAGDHLKSASDLGLPLVGIGLLYQEGYFRQYLSQSGWQNERYADIDVHSTPVQPVLDADAAHVTVCVDMPAGTCHARVWKVQVGRIPLYLLDTNIPENTDPALRDVSDRLYGGTIDTRVMQELLLGIGGIRALDAMGIDPTVVHVNEGHAAFCLLERTRLLMQRMHLAFHEAWRLTQAATVFTTHTPVPAGNEVFQHALLHTYLHRYIEGLGIDWTAFLQLGAQRTPDDAVGFSMTVLGLRGSAFRNGVSQLHGAVARTMWHDTWQGFHVHEVPIRGITNGIHTATWVSTELAQVLDTYVGQEWRTHPQHASSWARAAQIPASELWNVRQTRRRMLVEAARDHILLRHSASLTATQAEDINACLDPDIMTIGFARRFATYKRADLLMHDMDRLCAIVSNPDRPVQIVLAGKAHPRDIQGKELIQKVHAQIRQYGLERRIIFLEDYDMSIARHLVQGCDIWLNTPKRPHEASGTSGMKAALNGGLHCSILDGWWAEAYNGANGFAIGHGESADTPEQDASDAYALYDLLDREIVPLFYTRDTHGLPHGWLHVIQESIRTNAWRFAAHRMVGDYLHSSYVPAAHQRTAFAVDGARAVRQAQEFSDRVQTIWPLVRIVDVVVTGAEGAHVGTPITVRAIVHLAGLSAADVTVQALHGTIDAHGVIIAPRIAPLQTVSESHDTAVFEGTYACDTSGVQGCTVRIVPVHPTFTNVPDAMHVTYAGTH
jgi:starch phosphorylase